MLEAYTHVLHMTTPEPAADPLLQKPSAEAGGWQAANYRSKSTGLSGSAMISPTFVEGVHVR